MNWSEHLPTFLIEMFGPASVACAENAQTNTAPEPIGVWVPAHPNEEPPF